ncbi:MAG: class I adenylate-forming enzyme family protein [Trebonia sp.]|jgi:acyl-CoA synthetase (AMP-forming)/AMP-acid ligase II
MTGASERAASPGQPASLLAAFRERAESDSEATFVSALDGGQWSYGQIAGHVDLLAEAIGIAPFSPVIGAYGGNNAMSVIALLAAWQAGRCLACCGRQVPADAARPLFELAGCATVLAEDVAPFAGGPWQALPTGSTAPSGETAHAAGSAGPVGSGEFACICFTSGTTGKPKAVTMTHRHLVEQAVRLTAAPGKPGGWRPRVGVGRPVVSFSPFGHNGFQSWLGMALWLGRGLVLIDKFSVDAAVAAVARFAPPTLTLTPTMIQMLATAPGQVELPGVKSVTSSTAPLAPDIKELFSARFGIPILQAYGMTEFGNVAKEHLADVLAGRQPRGSVGRVSPGREVRIVGDDGAPLGPGEEGKLLVRATGRAAPPGDVAVGPDGWFDTGDRGALTSDGILIVSGRTSDRIIVGGFNVVPAEVELEIRGSGLVIDAVVVGLPDDRLGEVPVAGVVWKGDDRQADLLAGLRHTVAHYKLPRRFFSLTEIPRTPYGKVDRKKAAELARTLLGAETIRSSDARR